MNEKQTEIYQKLKEVVDSNGIHVRIDCDGAGINYPIAVDVEHDEKGNLVCIGAYDNVTREAHCFTKVTSFVKETVEKAYAICHSGMSDIECLRHWGIKLPDNQFIWDTMLMGHILDSSKKDYSLKGMAKRELGIEYPEYDEIVGKHKGKTKKSPACNKQQSDCCGRITLDKQPIEIVSLYNACDCFATWKLYTLQKKAIVSYV